MKSRDALIIRLLQETGVNLRVIARDLSTGKLFQIESITYSDVSCTSIEESTKGPLAHNEGVLVLECQQITQRITVP